jgi:hypothetical protein
MLPDELDALHEGIHHFIKRIELVRQAMSDLRPLMFSDFDMRTASMDEGVEFQRRLHTGPWSGVWYDADQHEWNYVFHGGGCCLTHPVTGETIDWDVSKNGAFDKFFFIRWLISLMCAERGDLNESQRNSIEKEVRTAFDQLVTDGRLICLDHQYRTIYKLPDNV